MPCAASARRRSDKSAAVSKIQHTVNLSVRVAELSQDVNAVDCPAVSRLGVHSRTASVVKRILVDFKEPGAAPRFSGGAGGHGGVLLAVDGAEDGPEAAFSGCVAVQIASAPSQRVEHSLVAHVQPLLPALQSFHHS